MRKRESQCKIHWKIHSAASLATGLIKLTKALFVWAQVRGIETKLVFWFRVRDCRGQIICTYQTIVDIFKQNLLSTSKLRDLYIKTFTWLDNLLINRALQTTLLSQLLLTTTLQPIISTSMQHNFTGIQTILSVTVNYIILKYIRLE